jgi:hypothetical protein
MKNIAIYPVMLSLLACGGCGYKYGPQPDPAFKLRGEYKEPEFSQSSASIAGSVLEARPPMVNEAIRARVEAIDELTIPSPKDRVPGAVRLIPGNHEFLVVCEDEAGENETYVQFNAEIINGHLYTVRCKEKTVWLNVVMIFWVEDQTGGGTTILKTEAWGPNHRSVGQTF